MSKKELAASLVASRVRELKISPSKMAISKAVKIAR
jgi:hypothetical protein